jgi:hypothetical protein
MTIKARPQLNGNTTDDFANVWVAINDARRAIELAAHKALSDVANGRNYQHLGTDADADAAVIADRRRIQEDFRKAAALLGEIGSDILDVYDAAIGDTK